MKNNKMKNCKACGAEVAKSAKSCPHCGAKLKKSHPILAVVLVLVILVAIIGSSGDDDEAKKVEPSTPTESVETTPEKEAETPTENPEPAPEQPAEKENKNAFYVGETAELKGVNVALVSVTESTGSAFNTPTEGNVFVLCEFEIANNSNKEITVSSVLSFEAYCDDYTCNFSLGALLEKGNKNQLDGNVAAGKKFNGVIGYEVPADWKELEIIFTPDFWSGKDITFIATNG
ncbi:MAG: DUF5067 domain-containing protein [Ruminococcaceae bacterium]|nr:DUF5067 domain-containing protein [Oscillospiraceae bacterium]